MGSKIDGPGVGALAGGTVFVFSGIRGYSILKAITNIIQGKSASDGQSVALLTSSGDGSSGTSGGNPPPVGSNQQIGQQLAAKRGWTGSQWTALDALWTRESRWETTATNPSSGAYGIPQALPGSKMASAGSDWKTNPVTQIKWGLSYIAQRYGNPVNAEAHENQFGWY